MQLPPEPSEKLGSQLWGCDLYRGRARRFINRWPKRCDSLGRRLAETGLVAAAAAAGSLSMLSRIERELARVRFGPTANSAFQFPVSGRAGGTIGRLHRLARGNQIGAVEPPNLILIPRARLPLLFSQSRSSSLPGFLPSGSTNSQHDPAREISGANKPNQIVLSAGYEPIFGRGLAGQHLSS